MYTAFELKVLASRVVKEKIVKARPTAVFYFEYKGFIEGLSLPWGLEDILLKYPPYEVIITGCYLKAGTPYEGLCTLLKVIRKNEYGVFPSSVEHRIRDYSVKGEYLHRILYILLKTIQVDSIHGVCNADKKEFEKIPFIAL